MRRCIPLLATLLLIASAAGPAQAQQLPWEQTNGPPGGDVSELVRMAGSELFAAVDGRMYNRDPQMRGWALVKSPASVYSFYKRSSDSLLVGTSDGAFWYLPRERRWVPIGLQGRGVGQVVQSRSQGFFAISANMIWHADREENWQRAIAGTDTSCLSRYSCGYTTLTVREEDGVVYSGEGFEGGLTGSGIIYRWDADSTRWDEVGRVGGLLRALKASEEGIYAGTVPLSHRYPIRGLYRIREGEEDTLLRNTGVLSVALGGGNTIYAGTARGAMRSPDGGNSWNLLSEQEAVQAFAFGSDGAVYTGGGQHCDPALDPPVPCYYGQRIMLREGKAAWRPYDAGIVRSHITTIALQEGTGNLYALTLTDLWRSRDAGLSWRNFATKERASFVHRYATSMRAASWGDIYAVTRLYSPVVFRWSPKTKRWRELRMHGHGIRGAQAIHTDSDSTLLIARGDTLYRSTDRGASWRIRDTAHVHTFAKAGGVLYAGADSSSVLRSRNNGATWTRTRVAEVESPVRTVAGSGETIYAVAGRKLYRSIDAGATWSQAHDGSIEVQRIVTNEQGALFLLKGDPDWWSSGGQLLYSDDQGATLTPLTGLPHNITAIALDEDDYLYAGTGDAGVWRARSTQVSIEDPSGTGTKTVELRANYPNPFRSSTTIPFSLPQPAHIELAIYDVLGRKVAVLVDGQRRAGHHVVRWQAKGLTGGTYFVRLKTPRHVRTEPLTLVK